MAAEFLLVEDRYTVTNLTYSPDQITMLRLHHRDLFLTSVFKRRVSYRITNNHELPVFDSQELDVDDFDHEDYVYASKRGSNVPMSTTVRPSKPKRPRFTRTKATRLFRDTDDDEEENEEPDSLETEFEDA